MVILSIGNQERLAWERLALKADLCLAGYKGEVEPDSRTVAPMLSSVRGELFITCPCLGQSY